jgi:hypothetical protein
VSPAVPADARCGACCRQGPSSPHGDSQPCFWSCRPPSTDDRPHRCGHSRGPAHATAREASWGTLAARSKRPKYFLGLRNRPLGNRLLDRFGGGFWTHGAFYRGCLQPGLVLTRSLDGTLPLRDCLARAARCVRLSPALRAVAAPPPSPARSRDAWLDRRTRPCRPAACGGAGRVHGASGSRTRSLRKLRTTGV